MTTTEPELPETERPRHLGSLLRRAQQVHVALWARSVSDRVSSVQFATLELLVHLPGASQKDIGEGLGLDRSTVTDVVRRMERVGLIERTRDPADNRRNVVVLTALGRSEYDDLLPRVLDLQHELVNALTPEETAELRRLLGRVVAAHEHLVIDRR